MWLKRFEKSIATVYMQPFIVGEVWREVAEQGGDSDGWYDERQGWSYPYERRMPAPYG
jgi:hypothetical protein